MENKYYSQQYLNDGTAYLKCYTIRGGSYRFCWHNTMEIMLVLQGSIDIYVEGKAHNLIKDDLIIINSNCGHEAFCKDEDSIILVMELYPEYFTKSLEMDFIRIGCASTQYTRDSIVFEEIRFYVSKIISYCMMNEDGVSKNIKAFLDVLIIELMHNFTVYQPMEDKLTNNKDGKVLDKAVEYIEKHYQDKISLDDVAKYVGYNRTYFSTLFKKNTDISFNEYLMRLRLKKAIECMDDDSLSIMDIALKNGFSSTAMFDKYMKMYSGMTPGVYREKLKNNSVMKRNSENERYYDYPNENIEDILKVYILRKDNESYNLGNGGNKVKKLMEYCENIADVFKDGL